MQCLRAEEQGQKLYVHLSQHQVISELPLMDWFHTCFANILADTSLERCMFEYLCDVFRSCTLNSHCSHCLLFPAVHLIATVFLVFFFQLCLCIS